MCGVIGYVGSGASPHFFYQGLKRLEYRGYDSAGIAMIGEDGELSLIKSQGKLHELEKKLCYLPKSASTGIGHTRWATHGKPSESNAHPHQSGPIVLLHNGIIENYTELKAKLIAKGYNFTSETDTEVAVHLLHDEYRKIDRSIPAPERMFKALNKLIPQLKGSYAFAIICLDTPNKLYAVKYGSPLALGRGDGEYYLASGITALVDHTDQVTMLDDGDIALLSPEDGIVVYDKYETLKNIDFFKITMSAAMLDKGQYDHYMLKEIHEHPASVAATLSERIDFSDYSIDCQKYGVGKDTLTKINRLQLIACGTSYYAAVLAKYFIEDITKLPVEVDIASEYRYRTTTADENTLTVVISQSGETIDTLYALKAAKARGAITLAIVNTPGSSIALTSHFESLLHAGPEICVASTKAFSSQAVSLHLLGLAFAQQKQSVKAEERQKIVQELLNLPALMEKVLNLSDSCKQLADKLSKSKSILYIGRGSQWAVAQEGALKLKELCYIYAEAYAAGELKHGPIALIDEDMTVLALAPKDRYYEKTISNIEEIKARGGKIFAIGDEGDKELKELSDYFLGIPKVSNVLKPFITTIPVHLFAYWMAVFCGTDIDQPRNLAKSVTVE
jgi:glutamine---fructose-6-phosphate transaminase (isomerizing)